MLCILIILFLVLALFANIAYCWRKLIKYNQCPLELYTFDGKESPYHPSVVYFKNRWNGYKYYLAQTPFYCGHPNTGENYRDRYECPSIHVSNDGIHWEEKTANPIDQLSEGDIADKDYFSDPHLVFKENNLECWYRINRRHGDYNDNTQVSLLRKISKDGISWGDRELVADLTTANHPLGNMIVSQSVLYLDGQYRMWYVNDIADTQRDIAYSSSVDAHTWSKAVVCTIKGCNVNPWHIDVTMIDGVYWLVIYDRIDISLWTGVDGLIFKFVKKLITPSKVIGSFYSNDLYRACLIKCDCLYRLYFSADDQLKTSIGVMEGVTPEELGVISTEERMYSNLLQLVKVYVATNKLRFFGYIKRELYICIKRPIINLIHHA